MPSVTSVPDKPPFGFNVVGYVTGNLGMGVATRNTLRALVENDIPVTALNVDAFTGRIGPDTTRSGLDTSFSYLEGERPSLPYGVNLFHINPPGIRSLMIDRHRWLRTSPNLNACVPFWELESLPADWRRVLSALDVVLAPSHFIQTVLQAEVPATTCLHYPQAVFIPDDLVVDREAWGIRSGETAFVASFDVSSGFGRKNPWAAIDAFQRAFPGRQDVRLLVKTNPHPTGGAQATDRLRRIATADPRLTVIEAALSYRGVLELYAACDVLVSLHRSEGLGLNMLEALSLGKPVVATGWSGNMDFTTPENSCLVGYKFISVDPDEPNYPTAEVGPSAVWADPDVDEAAAFMRALADSPEMRARLGKRGLEDMDARRRDYERGSVFRELQQLFIGDEPLWAGHADRLRSFGRLSRTSPYRRLRRSAGRALRQLGLRI